LDRGLTQPEVAKQLGVGLATVLTWEMNKKQPRQTQASKIIKFIGYIPYNLFNLSGMEFREQLRLARTIGGFSIEEFSKSFDCDASNLSRIELGKHTPTQRLKKKLEGFIRSQGLIIG